MTPTELDVAARPQDVSPPDPRTPAVTLASMAAAAMALSACGGGSEGSDSATALASSESADSSRAQAQRVGTGAGTEAAAYKNYTGTELAVAFAADRPGKPTAVAAARFLAQAAFGPSVASMAAVRSRGQSRWIEDQFKLPLGETHFARLTAMRAALGDGGYTGATFGARNNELILNDAWRSYMVGTDLLRQRMVASYLEIFVINSHVGGGIGLEQNQSAAAGYVDMLEALAFANFRQILEGISTSVAMGVYLSFRDNVKAEYDVNGVEIRVPDENFARELLQLFSIGLYALKQDGTVKTVDGVPQETYVQADIFNLARVFTGWRLSKPVDGEPDSAEWARPMVAWDANHSPEEKRFLGQLIPAGTPAVQSMNLALDIVFNHPNVGPFIGKQLIQRLVTSNPSGAYVARVTKAFNNNGSGERGDMKAVIRAILLDPEARAGDDDTQPSTVRGKVREPMMRLITMARAMEVGDPGTVVFPIANLSRSTTGIGQTPLQSPTVFNFFRPGYVPPQSELGLQGHVAPEFQIVRGPIIAASVNKINEFVRVADTLVLVDLRHFLDLAADGRALVDRVSLMLTGATVAEVDLQAFADLVSTLPAKKSLQRVQLALQLVASSAAFVVQAH